MNRKYNNRYDIEGCGNDDGNGNKLYYPNFYENYENSKQFSKNSHKTIPDSNHKIFNPSSSSIEANVDESPGTYSLQSGAFSLQENAESQKIYLMSSGFNVHITKLYRKTKNLYAVRIGYYSTEKEAEKVGNKIKSKLDLDTIIVKNK